MTSWPGCPALWWRLTCWGWHTESLRASLTPGVTSSTGGCLLLWVPSYHSLMFTHFSLCSLEPSPVSSPQIIFLMSHNKGSSCLYHPAQSPSLSYTELLTEESVFIKGWDFPNQSTIENHGSRITEVWCVDECFKTAAEADSCPAERFLRGQACVNIGGIFLPPDLNRGKNLLLIRALKSTFNKNCD